MPLIPYMYKSYFITKSKPLINRLGFVTYKHEIYITESKPLTTRLKRFAIYKQNLSH